MHKKFEMNWTKIKGGCQSGRKVATHNSKSDLTLEEQSGFYIYYTVRAQRQCPFRIQTYLLFLCWIIVEPFMYRVRSKISLIAGKQILYLHRTESCFWVFKAKKRKYNHIDLPIQIFAKYCPSIFFFILSLFQSKMYYYS